MLCNNLVSTIWFWDCSSPDDSFFGICSHQKPNDHTNSGLELTIMFSPLRMLKTLSRATCTSSLASDPRLTLKLPPPLTLPLSTHNLTTVTPSFSTSTPPKYSVYSSSKIHSHALSLEHPGIITSLLSITYNSLQPPKPTYLRELFTIQPTRSTRSSSCLTLS